MSPESFTNALLIALIALIGFVGGTNIKKINELIKEVRALLLSDLNNKKDINELQRDVRDLEERISKLESN